ncbi:MAG: DNA translocase FtsK [Oscillospiraceae bacterium]|nr:DNA translocase FtsK [Oscillospiraceae bacterium]
MATQKKTTKKSAAAPRKTTSRGSARKPKKQPVRREVGGAVCLLLALFVGIGYFQHEAIFLRWLYDGWRGLTGWGWYAALPALLLCSYILLFHRARPVASHLVCALALPVLIGALTHIGVDADAPEAGAGAIRALWNGGVALESGGVLSGGLAVGFTAVVGKVGALVVFAVALAACLMGALRLTPAAIVDAVKSYEPAPYDEPEEPPARAAVRPVTPEKPRASIDIPLDDPAPRRKKPNPLLGGVKGGFFAKKADHIRTPDELLTDAPADEPEVVIAAAPSAAASAEPPKLDPIAPPEPMPDKLDRAEVRQATAEVTAEIEAAEAVTPEYRYPPITLLEAGAGGNAEAAGAELRENSRRLAETIRSFGVDAAAGDVIRGPSVTRYEFTLEQGVKLSKLTNLQDDIALALGATGVRIAPIPDKSSVVGIEVPNRLVTPVHIRDVLETRAFTEHRSNVAFAVGKDINGSPIVGDIARFPHVLIAGTTGSGKSVCTNSLIVSMLYKSTPEDVRFIMVDPKMVELAPYNGIPHLLIPVVTDPKKAAGALQWAVYEMMKRYQIFSNHGVKDLASYNALAESDSELRHYPTVVVVIDELADLMLVAAKEVEESICRVAQMGRAAGMHLVIATQRPSADVITGLMKANIPSRIAFAVASSLESRIILDNAGAEKLVGKGDMLYAPLGEGKPRRVQGCFISADEIERVVAFVKEHGEASYDADVIDKIEQSVAEKERGKGAAPAEETGESDADELLDAAIEVVLETGQASTSLLQRRLKLGYSRAARIVDQMEQRGVVGPFEGSKPRQLLITKEQWQELKMKGQQPEEAAPPEDET